MEGAPLGVRWVQPLLVIVRELLALSALWWWTDLTAIVRDGKGRFGKVGCLAKGWHTIASVLSCVGVCLGLLRLLALGQPTIAALLVTASPALSLAATSAGAGFPALLVQRVLGSPPLLALGARLGKDALALWALNGAEVLRLVALSAAFWYASYGLLNDVLTLARVDLKRRTHMPTLDRPWGAQTPAAQMFGDWGVRRNPLHYSKTKRGTEKASPFLGFGTSFPEMLPEYDPSERPRPYAMPRVFLNTQEEGEGDQALSPSERRMKRAGQSREETTEEGVSTSEEGKPMMPILQSLEDAYGNDDLRDYTNMLRVQGEVANGTATQAEADAAKRKMKRFDRSFWLPNDGKPDAHLKQWQFARETWARRAGRTAPMEPYDLRVLERIQGTDDLRARRPPSLPSSEAEASASKWNALDFEVGFVDDDAPPQPPGEPGELERRVRRFLERDSF